jgi:hypothetical protein
VTERKGPDPIRQKCALCHGEIMDGNGTNDLRVPMVDERVEMRHRHLEACIVELLGRIDRMSYAGISH